MDFDYRLLSKWGSLVADWKKGMPVDKDVLLKLLDDSIEPPIEALSMIAALFRKEASFKRGAKPRHWFTETKENRRAIATWHFMRLYGQFIPSNYFDDEVIEFLPVPEIRRKPNVGNSIKEDTRAESAEILGIDVTTLDKILSEFRIEEVFLYKGLFGIKPDENQ